jgi:hypothetical protein
MEDFAAPDEVLAEVTYDRRFTGGELVQTSAEAVADLVAAVVDGGAATRSRRRPEQP